MAEEVEVELQCSECNARRTFKFRPCYSESHGHNAEGTHEKYLAQLEEVHGLQQNCLKAVKHQKYRLGQIKESLKTKLRGDSDLDDVTVSKLQDVQTELAETKTKLEDMQNELPVENNGYNYKNDYELFKFNVTCVVLVVVFFCSVIQTRTMDAICYFLMVWYYCTLTIRESILRVNGSRIKGWWVAHHYASCVLCGITLTWKDGVCYQEFRGQFLVFSVYIAVVQLMQCQYQKGCLRRLHALGQRHSMDITVEGFSSWMFKGLTFLLPFLIAGYIFQFYNALRLLQIWWAHGCEGEWQVIALCILFLLIGIGNSVTTGQVILRKVQDTSKTVTRRRLVTKYSSPRGNEVKTD